MAPSRRMGDRRLAGTLAVAVALASLLAVGAATARGDAHAAPTTPQRGSGFKPRPRRPGHTPRPGRTPQPGHAPPASTGDCTLSAPKRTVFVPIKLDQAATTATLDLNSQECPDFHFGWLSPAPGAVDTVLSDLKLSLTYDDQEQPIDVQPSASQFTFDWRLAPPSVGTHTLVLTLTTTTKLVLGSFVLPPDTTVTVTRTLVVSRAPGQSGPTQSTTTTATTPPPTQVCKTPQPVDLTSGVNLNVGTSTCLLFHVSWTADSEADRAAFLANTRGVFAVDGKPVQYSYVLRRSDGKYVADAEWTQFSFRPGKHTIAFGVSFLAPVQGPTGALYGTIPTGSGFVAVASVDAIGADPAPGPPTVIPPCPATAGPNGASFGVPSPNGPVCQPWGVDANPVPIDATAGALDPPQSFDCGGAAPARVASFRATQSAVDACPVAVASIILTDGHAYIKRRDGTLVRAEPGMPLYIGDSVGTDDFSMAAVEFAVGGKILLNEGSLICISGDRQALNPRTMQVLKLASGGIGLKWQPTKTPLVIRTRNSVIGIRD